MLQSSSASWDETVNAAHNRRAQMVAPVRVISIDFNFLGRDGQPFPGAKVPSVPMAPLHSGLGRRTVSLIAARFGLVVGHHPGGIELIHL